MWTYRIEDADTTRIFLPLAFGFGKHMRSIPFISPALAVASRTVYIIMDDQGRDWCWTPVETVDTRTLREFCRFQNFHSEMWRVQRLLNKRENKKVWDRIAREAS